MVDKELQELHDCYNKHEPAGMLYIHSEHPRSGIAKCACGRWFYYSSNHNVWEPLFGRIIADFVDEYPELWEPMHEYLTGVRPPGCDSWPIWEEVVACVSPAVRAMHHHAPVAKVPSEPQLSAADVTAAQQVYMNNLNIAPSPYMPKEYVDDGSIYKGVTITSTDSSSFPDPSVLNKLWNSITKDTFGGQL
jgi:hypothetical protein